MSIKGTVFDIKEFSIHDGPGARVTVFLKGCPLRCMWCHNPEGLSSVPQLLHKKNLCTECGRCLRKCDHPECQSFGRCIHACVNGALSIAGREYTVEELCEKIRSYKTFFDAAGGGVTLSGGDPLCQPEFTAALCHSLDGIHKAIQTSGFAPCETYREVISGFDYVMQDIKIADPQLHKKYTGVSNENILKNIEYLKSSGKEFVFRVPLIPDITDTDENLKAIAEIAGDFPVELLRYNALAGAKYEYVGKEYLLGERKNRDADFLSFFRNAKFG